jgi:predicted acyl esterase
MSPGERCWCALLTGAAFPPGVDNAHADLFVRLCDVDQAGVSCNITDVIQRLDPAVPAGRTQHLTLTLDPCAYRITAGHSVRLQISGGAHPRYARNLGVPGLQTTATDTAASTHTIRLHESRIMLPTLPR